MKDTELYRLCAGLFMVGFPGPVPTDEVNALIDDGVFGAILFAFKKNLGTAEETRALIARLKSRAGRPLALAVDQEGGRVQRLKGPPFTNVPTMRALGDRGDLAAAERVGQLLAYELRAVGFDWDFAPVLDVDTNPNNPVIGDRAFSRDPQVVARLGVALAWGLESRGVASCAKHFPGHGDTEKDSHLALPSLPHGLKRLHEVELVPFLAYAKARLASVMTAHVVFEALDKDRPATMSKKAMTSLLREELGFEGVIVSDDLEMKAIVEHFTVERAVVEGLEAGVDLFLVCHTPALQRRAIAAAVDAVKSGRLTVERLEQSRRRLETLSARFVRDAPSTVSLGSAEHLALARGLSAEAFVGRDPTEAHHSQS